MPSSFLTANMLTPSSCILSSGCPLPRTKHVGSICLPFLLASVWLRGSILSKRIVRSTTPCTIRALVLRFSVERHSHCLTLLHVWNPLLSLLWASSFSPILVPSIRVLAASWVPKHMFSSFPSWQRSSKSHIACLTISFHSCSSSSHPSSGSRLPETALVLAVCSSPVWSLPLCSCSSPLLNLSYLEV